MSGSVIVRPSIPTSAYGCACSAIESGSPSNIASSRSRGTPSSAAAAFLRSASSCVAPMSTPAMRVRVISDGSRPTSSQWRSSTPSRCLTRSTSPNRLQPSPYWATKRSVLRSPLPPMRIGMSPRSGFGLLSAPWTLWWVPSTVARSSVNIARAIRSVSSRRSKRSLSGGKRKP